MQPQITCTCKAAAASATISWAINLSSPAEAALAWPQGLRAQRSSARAVRRLPAGGKGRGGWR